MKTLTRLDDDKSKLYDKFIKYLKDKGYSTPIPTTVTDEIKALGIDRDIDLVEILDAMLERNIIAKGIGDTEPKFVLTESELDTLVKEPENLQEFVVTRNKLTNLKKEREIYKAEFAKYKEAILKKQFENLTKFELSSIDGLGTEPDSEYLDDPTKSTARDEAIAEAEAKFNPAFIDIIHQVHKVFNWKQLIEDVSAFKRTMSENSEFIKKIEKDCKDGKLDKRKITNLYEFKRIDALNITIQNHLAEILSYQENAVDYGISIIAETDKLTISSSKIPELKFEQPLLSKELQEKISKTEEVKFGGTDLPEPLNQEEFKKIIQRQKILLKDTDPDQSSCLGDIQTIIAKEEASTDKENTTTMVLSMNDDGELKYYKVRVLNSDLDVFKSLISKCKTINESDDMVPTPIAYDKDKMTVPEYENYLTRFYKTYGLDKDYITTEKPLYEKRDPYPHERTGIGHTYYETIYSEYIKTYKKADRAANNDKLISILTAEKDRPGMEDTLKAKIDELIALLTIDDLPTKMAAGTVKEGIGFVYEDGKLPQIKAKVAEIDPLGKIVPIIAVPMPREKGPSETIEDYENYLLNHYKTYMPSLAPTKNPVTEEIRKPYPHERLAIDKDGNLSMGTPAKDGYYNKFYYPYCKENGIKEITKLSDKKPFSGRRKVTASEDGLEHKGVIAAFKKFGEKLSIFDKSFTDEKSKKIKELIKRVFLVLLAIAAVVILLQIFAPGLLPWNFFPIVGRWIGRLGSIGPLSAGQKSAVLGKIIMAVLAALGAVAVLLYAKWKKVFKKTTYPHPDRRDEATEEETVDTPETEPLPEEPPSVEDIEGLLDEGADFESILGGIIAKYAEAKRDYKAAEELASDPEHATDEIKADRDTKLVIKDKRKEDLVDTILIGLAHVEPEEMKEEIGGMSL